MCHPNGVVDVRGPLHVLPLLVLVFDGRKVGRRQDVHHSRHFGFFTVMLKNNICSPNRILLIKEQYDLLIYKY